MAVTEVIERKTLHGELVERLRELIVEGALVPGEKIAEKALCERFGVSRTPLREALKVLAADGFIELTPNRGATVSRLTVEDLDNVFPIIGALEALAGELACRQRNDEELAEIRALHYQMVLHYKRGERSAYFQLNQQIHEAIMAAARNPDLARSHRTLSGRIRRARYQANMSSTRWDKAIAEHEEILKCLENRDDRRIGEILKQHLANKLATVKESLLTETAERAAPL